MSRRLGQDSDLLRAVVLLVVLVGAGFGLLLLDRAVPWLDDPVAAHEFVGGFGLVAPAIFVLVQAAQVVLAPVPGHVLGFVGGYLFGAALGTALSLLGATIGTYVAVAVVRRLGRPSVERLVSPATIDRFDAAVDRRGSLALFIVFLIPGLPDDAICFVAGLTRLEIRRILIVSAVGRLPGYAFVSLAGARFAGGHVGDAVLLVGGLAVVTALVYLRRRSLLRWLVGPEVVEG